VDTASAAAPRSVDSIWDLGNKAGLWVENGKLKQKIRELDAQREREERERTLLGHADTASGISDQHAAAWAEQERTIKLLKAEVARLKTERSRDAEKIHDLQSIIRSSESKKNESKNLAKARSFAEVLEVLYMSDDELEVKFNQLADLMHRGNAVMSRQGFRKALAAFNVAMTPAEADEAFDVMDDNKDGHVDFSEFLKSTKKPTQLELVLGSQHNVIVRALASALVAEAGGSEDPLTVYLNLSMTNISAAVAKFEPFLQKIVYRWFCVCARLCVRFAWALARSLARARVLSRSFALDLNFTHARTHALSRSLSLSADVLAPTVPGNARFKHYTQAHLYTQAR
jgi:hypothetical protein